jgi:hypothetical protein
LDVLELAPELEPDDEPVWAAAGNATKAAVDAIRSEMAAAIVHAGARVMKTS